MNNPCMLTGQCGGPSLEGSQVGFSVTGDVSLPLSPCRPGWTGWDGPGCIPVIHTRPHLLGPRAGGVACSRDKTATSHYWVRKGGKSEEGFFFFFFIKYHI